MAALDIELRLSSSTVTLLTAALFYPSYTLFLLGMTCATSYGFSFI